MHEPSLLICPGCNKQLRYYAHTVRDGASDPDEWRCETQGCMYCTGHPYKREAWVKAGARAERLVLPDPDEPADKDKADA